MAITFAFMLSAIVANAQEIPIPRDAASKKTIGSYDFSITYKYEFAKDTISSKRHYDMYCLEIGTSFSRYYSLYADKCDSLMYKARTDNRMRGEGGVRTSSWMNRDQEANYEDFYLNYPQKGILTNRTAIINTEYEYSEPMHHFTWALIPDSTAVIMGYECRLAKASFRGREYYAYFTPDIPLQYGPWKFYDLPGLILKVNESSGQFQWEAVGLSDRRGNIYMHDPSVGKASPNIPSMTIRKVKREQLAKLQRKRWDDPAGLSQLHGQKLGVVYDLSTKKSRPVTEEDKNNLRMPYIPPLELE